MNDRPESPVHFCFADEQQLPFHCSNSWCHCHSVPLFLSPEASLTASVIYHSLCQVSSAELS